MTKFKYPCIETTEMFDMRWYQINKFDMYPSITTILGYTQSEEKRKSLENWRNSIGHDKADEWTNRRANSGTNVHLMIEHYLNKQPLDISKYSELDIGVFNSLKLKLKNIDNILDQEVALYSDDLKIAGRCDCIGHYSGVLSIIDFKTTGRAKKSSDIEDYWLQCCFYAEAHNEMFGTDISNGVILMGNETGIPLVWQTDLKKYKNKLEDRINQFYLYLQEEIL